MRFRKFLATLLILSALIGPSYAAQNSVVLPLTSPYPGLTMLGDINNAFATFASNFSGPTAPSTITQYQLWVDTTNSLIKFTPDGTNWVAIGKYSSSTWAPLSNGVISTIPSSTGGSNAYVVTYSPVVTALVVGQHYPFISNFQNTSTATEKINALTAHAITKQGAVALVSNDIPNGIVVDTVWDGTQFQMTSELGNASVGTVTSVGANNGVTATPSPITGSGTISLTPITNNTILCNASGITASPSSCGAVPNGVTVTAQTAGDTSTKPAPYSAFAQGLNGTSLVLLGTATASNSAIISFNGLTQTFNHFVVVFDNVVPATNGVDLDIRVSEDNGATFITAAQYSYFYNSCTFQGCGAAGNGGNTFMPLSAGCQNSSGNGVEGTLELTNLSSTSAFKLIKSSTWCLNSATPTPQSLDVYGNYNGDMNPINAVAFFEDSGNIASGNISIYGYRNQ